MALQHFYTRVPAKMSLFNKTDSYDTFAHSDGIERERMEKDLAVVYENKPTPENAALIQAGKLPPVYCQYAAGDGTMLQSCISFLAQDYTGERSTYLVHSLVFSEEEKTALLKNADTLSFNKAYFKNDLSSFDLTSFDSEPDTAYPAIDYEPLKREDALDLKQYDMGMLKRLIYALLQTACGKIKAVYLSLPEPIEKLSDKALDFINSLMRIFPYHIRQNLSFVTYVGDTTRFSSFKVKFQPENAPAAPTNKGVTVRMGKQEVVGFTDETVAASRDIVDFFYSLIDNDAVRKEFLQYCDNSVHALPALETPNIKTVTDLVFLFRQCSGLYDEKSVLPHDTAVYDFVCTYEKYRTALSDDYRAEALKCLWRYPQSKTMIPKNVFGKLTKIYKTETVASKRTVMNVALELIHTDVMREKLFTFITAGFAEEDPDMQTSIMLNLCRVYYGGFLQNQMLDFFEANFSSQTEEVRDQIVEKLLLTLRTAAIQAKILHLLDTHYAELTPLQKDRFYRTFFDMLPEGDDLAKSMTEAVNRHIMEEDDAKQDEIAKKLCEQAEKDQKRKEPKLLKLVVKTDGFCHDVILHQVMTAWSGRKIFDEFIEALWEREEGTRADALIALFRAVPDASAETVDRICTRLKAHFDSEKAPASLFKLIEAEEKLDDAMTSGAAKDFALRFTEECLHPAISRTLNDAFQWKKYPNGMTDLAAYVQDHTYLKKDPGYAAVQVFETMLADAKSGDGPAVIEATEKFEGKALRSNVAAHLRKQLLETDVLDGDAKVTMRLLILSLVDHLQNDTALLNEPYKACVDALRSDHEEKEAEELALKAILTAGSFLYGSALNHAYFADSVELRSVIVSFVQKYNKEGKAFVKETAAGYADHAYVTHVNDAADSVQLKKAGLFAKLFGKK